MIVSVYGVMVCVPNKVCADTHPNRERGVFPEFLAFLAMRARVVDIRSAKTREIEVTKRNV
jgi:hypothetical protein